jgi:hypothetical protein
MPRDVEDRRSLLLAALGFLQLREPPPEVARLRRWLDSWTGIGAVVAGMEHQGYDIDLLSVGPARWQATFLATNPHGGAPVAAGYAEDTRLWSAVQRAAWEALKVAETTNDWPKTKH